MDEKKSSFKLGHDPKPYIRTKKLHELPKDTRIYIRPSSETRDVYYNPKEFRSNSKPRSEKRSSTFSEPKARRRSDSTWATWLIITIIVGTSCFVVWKIGL